MNLERTYLPESPHFRSLVEWWFIQGYYEGKKISRRYFMSSLFRYGFPSEKGKRKHGYSLLLSLLDLKTRFTHTSTRIDKELFEAIAHTQSESLKVNIDPHLIKAFFDEIREYGIPREIEISKSRVRLQTAPFQVCWDDFSLRQIAQSFRLVFVEAYSRKTCRFKLEPCQPRLKLTATGEVSAKIQGMYYFSYPRLKLSGQLAGENVEGEAWLDHQWGDSGWLFSEKRSGRVLGWNWLGINMKDGSDWIVLVHTDVQSGKPIASHATVRQRNGNVHIYKNFSLTPLRNWESPKTAIRHPVEWRLEIPELCAELFFKPVVDDQEIPIFGLTRAIWEGAGFVSGTVGSQAISGRARGEFQGYGYIFDFEGFLKNYADRIDRHVENFLPKVMNEKTMQKYVEPVSWQLQADAFTEMLATPIWDLISRRGKRWRSIFCFLLLDALGTNPIPYENLISVLAELTHTGALIIDDIEDSSLLRRGEDCIHIRYGQDVAINAANTIYFLPTLLNFDHLQLGQGQKLEIQKIIMKQFVRSHFGQAMDLYWSRHMTQENLRTWLENSLETKILQMYEFKTASLIEGLAEIASIIAGVNDEVKILCLKFAKALGIAFQIVDDVHNFSRSANWRKVSGEDIAEGKMTYVIYRALQKLGEPEKSRLLKILGSKKIRRDKSRISEGLNLIRKSKALQECRGEAKDMVLKEWKNLAAKLESSLPKILLNMLSQSLVELDFKS